MAMMIIMQMILISIICIIIIIAITITIISILHGRHDPDFHLKKKTSPFSKLNIKLCTVFLLKSKNYMIFSDVSKKTIHSREHVGAK